MSIQPASPNWEAIELEYRKGIKPLRSIASEHNITEGAIRKRAKKEQWERDLSARINARADVLVRKKEVRRQYASAVRIAENKEVEIAATMQAQALLEQRDDLREWREQELMYLAENIVSSQNVELLQQLGEVMRSPDESGLDRLHDAFAKQISSSTRLENWRKIMEIRAKRIELTRRVLGIKDGDVGDKTVQITEIRLVGVMPQHGQTYEHAALTGETDEND